MTVADLTPDALAKLEAKLVADLEVVRKVRALLEEHQRGQGTADGVGVIAAPGPVATVPPQRAEAVGTVAMAGAAPPASGAVPGTYVSPAVPKTFEQWILDGLRLMPPEGFVLGDLKRQLRKDKQGYNDERAKEAIGRLMRAGRVVVVQSAIGRIGNTYRYVPTPEELAENAAAEAANATGSAEKDAAAAPEAAS